MMCSQADCTHEGQTTDDVWRALRHYHRNNNMMKFPHVVKGAKMYIRGREGFGPDRSTQVEILGEPHRTTEGWGVKARLLKIYEPAKDFPDKKVGDEVIADPLRLRPLADEQAKKNETK